ncbi:hypothetical protein AB0399_09865 [Streptomyces sp. NPDC088194]|uniref:hypothetical protein n=1 Tax=Streptomyces sp. NPDC088194 TaxID=3154931 RepID=UPI00344F97EC
MSVRTAEDHRHDHRPLATVACDERAGGPGLGFGTGPGFGTGLGTDGHADGPFTFAGLIARVQALNRRGR